MKSGNLSGNLWKLPHLLIVVLTLLLSACSGGSTANTSATNNAPTAQVAAVPHLISPGNASIALLIYGDTQRTPVGFYTETAPVFTGYVATHHLKNSDVAVIAVTTQYELCTDDFNQALQWSETANTNSGDHADLVVNDATDRYFEFNRVRAGTPQGYLRARIYKCAYLDRTDVDLHATTGNAGMLNVRPLTASNLQQLSEYLWQFTTYNNFGNVVLSSTGNSTAATLDHSLVIAALTRASVATNCDTINVLEWKHSLDKSNGNLTLSITPLWSFNAQQSNGVVSVCN